MGASLSAILLVIALSALFLVAVHLWLWWKERQFWKQYNRENDTFWAQIEDINTRTFAALRSGDRGEVERQTERMKQLTRKET